MDDALGVRRDRLVARLSDLSGVIVAYSGGVDSAYLAHVAHEVLRDGAVAVTAVSPSLAASERVAAEELARSRGWNHVLVETHELARPQYRRNSSDRCYWCKTELFDVLEPLARARGVPVALGTNVDDLGDHRPGQGAARERNVLAPLVEAGLSKADIRALSRAAGLPTADKFAAPCLASRIAYGVEVTPERLRRVDLGEEFLRALGFRQLRVRDHGELARIEVPRDELERAVASADEIARRFRKLGFAYVTLDLQGLRSGSLNEVLPAAALRIGAPGEADAV